MPKFHYQHGDRPLDGYTIEHGLGVGGFGEVYFAKSDAGREVAIKVVQNYADIELRGIQQCMNLKSPQLVTIYDVRFNEHSDPFVIMEYMQGTSLRDILDESPQGLGPVKSAFLIREIAKGLSFLHDAGVVHRDLKPNNVFYENGYVKIGDYSLCKLISSSHRSDHTMTVGTVHYMAPEISEGRYDASVDIYALGIMLHEMLTGEPTYTGKSVGEVLMKHMRAEPDLSNLDEPFRSIVAKAIAKDPENRFANPGEFVEALFGVEHVRNSIAEFNPQELTLVANQVASKIAAAKFAATEAPAKQRPKLTTPSGRNVDGHESFTEPWRGSTPPQSPQKPSTRETITQTNDDTHRRLPTDKLKATLQTLNTATLQSLGYSTFVGSVVLTIMKLTQPAFPGFIAVGLVIGALGCIIASATRKGFWPVTRLVFATILIASANTNGMGFSIEAIANLAIAVMLFVWPAPAKPN